MEPAGPAVVVSTFPDREGLDRLAERLVREGAAACVNIIPVESVYMWKGAVERGGEHLAVFKTTQEGRARLVRILEQEHPYEVPEIAEIRASVNAPYMAWIRGCVS